MNTYDFIANKGISNTFFAEHPITSTNQRETLPKPNSKVRSLTRSELVIEIDLQDNTSENKQIANQVQLKNLDTLEKNGYEVYFFSHNGKSPYLRLYGFNGINELNHKAFFHNFVSKYCEILPNGFKYDDGFYGSFHWVPLEFAEHYKYPGQKHELLKVVNEGKKNQIEADLLTQKDNNLKRKVDFSYSEILLNSEATEQERCSAVMQLHNAHKDWTIDDLFLYIVKNNFWSDFDKTITKDKISKLVGKYGDQNITINQITTGIVKETDYYNITEKIVKEVGIYYDLAKLWWVWNNQRNCWEIVDETTILSSADKAVNRTFNTLEPRMKSIIIEGLERAARENKPKELRKSQIQFKNKIIDVKTGEEIDATKEYFSLNPIPWEIGKNEDTPTIDRLFCDWVGPEKSKLLYEIIAFGLANDYFIHRLFCFTGIGSNGKSKFLELNRRFFGDENICSTELDLLTNSRFESARLYKKLLCLMGETDFSLMKRTGLIKRLSGEDPIPIEFKQKKPTTTINYSKIMIATNTLPQTTDRTDGFYRRWLIIDFPNQFTEGKNPLDNISNEEYENLGRKSIKILKELMQTNKFSFEGTIEERKSSYESHSNPIKKFIQENFVDDVNGDMPFFKFFEQFESYLKERNLRFYSKKEASAQLEQNGYPTEKRSAKKSDGSQTTWTYILGIRPKEMILDYNSNNTNNTKVLLTSSNKKESEPSVISVKSDFVNLVEDEVNFCEVCNNSHPLVVKQRPSGKWICDYCFEKGLENIKTSAILV